ncbi:hypothetical protein [uncultured Thiodictyon sp.]|uniref:hypothetical protein n=1 Tax=uncultured Thiodictyon sp. TaxID=1846217 RepID=UPI0025EA5E24|nr:hypothetical protein [uncultured Thiodictyon sp.]
MIDKDLEQRVARIEGAFRQVMLIVGAFDQEILKAIAALRDDYPEHTIMSCGAITESVLKRIWAKENIRGNPAKMTLWPLMQGLQEHIDERLV